MLNKVGLILFELYFFLSATLLAQNAEYEIFQLRFLYNDIKFEEVIAQGQQLLKNTETHSKNNLIEIHKYLALSFYNTSNQDSSRSHFYTLLSLDKDFEPDPVNTSPKILNFFNEIKTNFKMDDKDRIALPYTNYVFVEDIRPIAALKSFALPGWGQMYKEQITKAYLFGGSFLASSIITIATYTIERDYRKKYLNENNPAKVDSRYMDYNNMSKTRRIFLYGTIGIWAASVADALYSEYAPIMQVNEDYMGIAIRFSL